MGLSGTLMFFIWKTNKNYGLEEKRMLYVSLTVLLGLLAVFVLVVLCIRLLGFMTSPSTSKIKKLQLEEDHVNVSEMNGFYTHYDDETGNLVANFIFPEQDIMLNDIQFNWNKFKNCAGKGAQTRIQADEIGDIKKADFHVLLHVSLFFLL